MELMKNYNKDRIVILNTYQTYLKKTFAILKNDLERSIKENFLFGAKLVRGAYLVQERRLAQQNSYEDPVNPTYEATTQQYHNSLLYCIEKMKEQNNKNLFNTINIMVASHNEDTIRFALKLFVLFYIFNLHLFE
jgi:proline dehydrogenase